MNWQQRLSMRCGPSRQRSSVTKIHLGGDEPKRAQPRRLRPLRELTAEAEVRKLCDHRLQARGGQQDIPALDVPVHDTNAWMNRR